jgi:MFS transporter, PAT family, beta-lactamase induction signal transducer AmpG
LTVPPRRDNSPWLFGLLTLPFGVFNNITTALIPFLLRKHGVSVDRIAEVVAISYIPSVWYFLWSPVVDLGLRRRTWILIAAGVSALCGGVAVMMSAGSLAWLTLVLVAGNVVVMLLSSANGAILTTLHPSVRGRASGWYQAGNLGGGALGGGLTIWLASFAPISAIALVCVAMTFVPALAALMISEEPRTHLQPAILFRAMGRDVWDVLKAPATWVGLLFFLSPVGSAAVVNLISSLGPDYHASDAEVAWVSGFAFGLISAGGCLLGGFACDRMKRTTAYVLAGLFSSVFSLWLALGRATALTYAGGYIGYALAAGFAYAAFTALELDVLGRRPHAAGTAYSLLGSSGNLPIAYMTWLDGAAYKRAGRVGLMGMDTLANGLGAVLLLVFAGSIARRWMRPSENPPT